MDEKDVNYWEKRKAQRMFEYMQSAEDTADQIAKAYWKSSGYINHQLDEIYGRFKAKHKLSDAEAKRLLNRMQDKASFNELKNLLKQETDSDEKKELLKLIESPAYSARIQRLQDMQREIDQLMKSTYRLEKERSTRHYTNLMQDSYYKSIYDIQHDTGLAFSFSKIPSKQIDKVLKSKWSGTNYSKRIWNNTQKLAEDLKEELLINLMTGRTDREVAEIISNKFGSGAMEARRLVRTESCYIVNEMEGQSYEECGVEKYMFIATLDKRTSETCREHDHKVYLVKDRQPGHNCPPMHPWCRSTTIAYLDDDMFAGMERRARNPDTGKTYIVPGITSYREWEQNLKKMDDGQLRFELDVQNFATPKLNKSEKGALIRYVSPDAYVLNDKLRNGYDLSEDDETWIKSLDKALDKLPAYEGTVSRSLEFFSNDDIRSFTASHKVGENISYNQYLSTTCGEMYNENENVKLIINSKTGRDMREYNPDENEVLFKRDALFKVIDIDKNDDKILITLAEVEKDEK